MERKKNYILTMIFLFSVLMANASYKTEIYNAYISNQMDIWKSIIDKMEKAKKAETAYIHQLVNYQYGYIAWCIGNDKDDEAKNYLDLAEKNLEWLEDKQFSMSTINAYKSAFYGFKIGITPVKAPFLGPKSVNCSKLAMEQDKSNPMGYIQYGNSQFYMPPVFGGSKEEALKYFNTALNLMEMDKNEIVNDWNYLSLLALIGQSYEKTEQLEKAKIFYEKALEAESQFLYVKNELYPGILKKMKESNE